MVRQSAHLQRPRPYPLGSIFLLIPSWITFIVLERHEYQWERVVYYRIPDITENPIALLPNLTVTPLFNTDIAQILLVTLLLLTFGVLVELRLGVKMLLGVFWATSIAAALGAGLLLHALYPMFPDVYMFGPAGWDRYYAGGSAGGYGLLGAFAATSRRPMLWITLFLLWEVPYWLVISGDYTSVFHFIAVATGYMLGRWGISTAQGEGES
jgi:hypothetical protein